MLIILQFADEFKGEFGPALLRMKITILMRKRINSLFGLAFVEYHFFKKRSHNWRFKIEAHPSIFENGTFMRLRITILCRFGKKKKKKK